MNALKFQPRFRWLVDTQERVIAGKFKLPFTILGELGRIWDNKEIRTVAAHICKLKPKAADAVAMIRAYRTGKQPVGTVDGLYAVLCRAIDGYESTHAGVTHDMCRQAIERLSIPYELASKFGGG